MDRPTQEEPPSSDDKGVFSLLEKVLDAQGTLRVTEALNVTKSTVARWLLLKRVPSNYYFDLLKLRGIAIDYENFSYREKDQFFTPAQTALKCIEIFRSKLAELGVEESTLNYIEPSAGAGAFLHLLPAARRTGLDIEPRDKEIIEADYLEWTPSTTNNVVIGNPPFGLRGHTALRFLNHSAGFADFVAFILPQLFESDGKGTPTKRVKGFNLIHSEKVGSDFEDPEGNTIAVHTVFQIWSKNFTNPAYAARSQKCKNYIRVYSLSDGGTPGTTRNKDWIDRCDVYIPSTCYGSSKMKTYAAFEDLPNRKGYGLVFLKEKEKVREIVTNVDWAQASFKSTNSALNLRTSIIENELLKRGIN